MQPCLAATGGDPTLGIVLAAAVLVLGALLATVAIRRGKRRAVLLLIALPFLAAVPALITATPATAEVGVPCPTPTPTPTELCEPEEALEGATFVSPDGFRWVDSGQQPGPITAAFADGEEELYLELVAALLERADPPVIESVANSASDFGTPQKTWANPDGRIVLGELGWVVPTEVMLEREPFIGDLWIEDTYSYPDGCGGTLSTTITVVAEYDFRA